MTTLHSQGFVPLAEGGGMEIFMVYERIRNLREDMDVSQQFIAEYPHCIQIFYSYYEFYRQDIPISILNELPLSRAAGYRKFRTILHIIPYSILFRFPRCTI